ncbi:MAG: helix-turn-helix domain-containing protein [Candidatus Eisenbacteria bacterium]
MRQRSGVYERDVAASDARDPERRAEERADGSADESASSPKVRLPAVAEMVESVVGCKWSMRVLALCAAGTTRPSAIQRACPGLSAKVMNERFRKLIRFGILSRSVRGEKPPVEVDYELTPLGRRFVGILDEVERLQESVDRGEPGLLDLPD